MNPAWPLHVWADGTKWQAHVDWLLHQFMACKSSDPLNDRSPCNRFVGEALENVFGITDFRTAAGSYLSANDIVDYLLQHRPPWTVLGNAGDQGALRVAQDTANQGVPVVAVRPDQPHGHVALVIPGKARKSEKWGLLVPNSASFFFGKPGASYIGDGLPRAFSADSADKRFDVSLYVSG